jgi:hypothetical protein
MIDPRFDEQPVPDMVQAINERMQDMTDGSPEQIVYLYQTLQIAVSRALEDLMHLTSDQLLEAHEWLETF